MRHLSCCSASPERVEHSAVFRTSGEDARADEIGRERGEVGFLVGFRADCPHVALVAFAILDAFFVGRSPELVFGGFSVMERTVGIPAHAVFRDRLAVEVVPPAVGQQEDVLVRLGAAVFHTLGHGVRFVPDDVLTQIPPVGLQRERYAPRNADEVFGLETLTSYIRRGTLWLNIKGGFR